jgi:FdhE protein
MASNIQKLIEQRPHLKDPFEFYAKWQHFQHEIDGIMPAHRTGLVPAESNAYPPNSAGPVLRAFAAAFNLPERSLAPLEQALRAGELDFLRLPLGELPALSPAPVEGELATFLFLLSRPWFLRLRESSVLDDRQWEDGRCPVCSARTALTSIEEGPQRRLHCSWCGTSGTYRFIGCPNCGTVDSSKLGTLIPEGEPGFRVTTCDACHTYVKVVDSSLLKAMTPDLADLASLPLDIVAQGKDFARLAPNPIGMTRIP